MGARGPIPRPENELARPRSRKGSDEQATVTGLRREVLDWQPLDHWCDIARNLFVATRNSGQSDYFQDSDWSWLTFVCEEIHAYEESQKPYERTDDMTGEVRTVYPKRNGQWLSAILSSTTGLLFTEGDRRRIRMELREGEKPRPNLVLLAKQDYEDVRGKKSE